MDSTELETVHAELNARLDRMIEEIYKAQPSTTHLRDAESVNAEFYKRHTIETVLRMRLSRMADGKVLQLLARTRPRVAKMWAKYSHEEMLHDELFVKDLERLGVSRETIDGTDALLATKLLQGYFYFTLEHEGPMATVLRSYMIEYATGKTQGQWNANVARSLGQTAVKGASAHLQYDENTGHGDDTWEILAALLETPEDVRVMRRHVEAFAGLFMAYFAECSGLLAKGAETKGRPLPAPVVAVSAASA